MGRTVFTSAEDFCRERFRLRAYLSASRRSSIRRTTTTGNEVVREGVVPSRMFTMGYGEEQPVASNESASGRRENRRVEVAIYANKKLKKAAKRGDLEVE